VGIKTAGGVEGGTLFLFFEGKEKGGGRPGRRDGSCRGLRKCPRTHTVQKSSHFSEGGGGGDQRVGLQEGKTTKGVDPGVVTFPLLRNLAWVHTKIVPIHKVMGLRG